MVCVPALVHIPHFEWHCSTECLPVPEEYVCTYQLASICIYNFCVTFTKNSECSFFILQINLMEHVKPSVARDFRINGAVVRAALEEQGASASSDSEEEEENNDPQNEKENEDEEVEADEEEVRFS